MNFFKVIAAQSAYSTHFTVPVVGALIGIVVLFFGRKLFWLCVAAVGFAAGIELAPHLVTEPSPAAGAHHRTCSRRARSVARVLTSKDCDRSRSVFLQVANSPSAIAAAFFVHYSQYSTIIFVVGGLIGAMLLLFLFDWALIVVSSFIGAHMIQNAIVLPPTGSTIVFFGLAVVGMVVQAASLRRG